MEFIDLKAQYQNGKEEIDRRVLKVMANAAFIGGSFVEEFESDLAKYVGRKHCISCGNGTDALQLAYMAYGVKSGDAVFCPAMTFIASVEPAAMLGATPVFCDIDPVSYNISPDSLEMNVRRVIEEGKLNPRFVVAVDFLGNPAEYEKISSICERYGLILIEDAAQGISGSINGVNLGSFGNIATTSFFPSKPLGCYGDGGAVFTDDDEIASLIRSIRVHGKGTSKYDNVRIGVNSRLDNIQAAVLSVKLNMLEEEARKKAVIAKRYDDAFEGVLQYPCIKEGARSAYAQYILLANDEESRQRIMDALSCAGIPSLIYYPKPLHKMKAFGDVLSSCPVAEDYARRNFGLPISAYLTESDQKNVIDTVLAAV